MSRSQDFSNEKWSRNLQIGNAFFFFYCNALHLVWKCHEIKKICCQFEWWNRDLILLKINPVRGWVKWALDPGCKGLQAYIFAPPPPPPNENLKILCSTQPCPVEAGTCSKDCAHLTDGRTKYLSWLSLIIWRGRHFSWNLWLSGTDQQYCGIPSCTRASIFDMCFAGEELITAELLLDIWDRFRSGSLSSAKSTSSLSSPFSSSSPSPFGKCSSVAAAILVPSLLLKCDHSNFFLPSPVWRQIFCWEVNCFCGCGPIYMVVI